MGRTWEISLRGFQSLSEGSLDSRPEREVFITINLELGDNNNTDPVEEDLPEF